MFKIIIFLTITFTVCFLLLNLIKIIPKIINVREIGIIYFKDPCFLLIFIKFNNKKQTVNVIVKKIIILNI